MTWQADDRATFGEGIAWCPEPDCDARLLLLVGQNVIIVRCEKSGRLLEAHPVTGKD